MLAADLMTAAYPALPQDPVLTRLRWENPRKGFAYGRFIAEEGGKPIGFVAWLHGPWPEVPDKHCEVEAWLDRNAVDRDAYGSLCESLWRWISERAVAEDSALLVAYSAEDETESLAALAALGFERKRAEVGWGLDLKRRGAGLVLEARTARKRMEAEGVRMETLAAWGDPDKARKLHELNERTIQDVPHTLPILYETYEDFVKRLNWPDRPHDRYWIARDGDRPVALSYLKFPPVRGTVWTGYTATEAEYRGRGIARAVKLQGLAQAVALGVGVVCTDNDSENAPMLHINETLGYERRTAFIEHHKRVRNEDA